MRRGTGILRAWLAALGVWVAAMVLATPVSAIVNASGPAGAGSWPWAVQVIVNNGENFCGGVLVGPARVVTAGHCVDGFAASAIQVLAGTHALDNGQQSTVGVTKISEAANYQADTGTDVAVLTLASAAGTPAAPINLLRPSESSHFTDGVSAQLAGWGVLTPNALAFPVTLYQGTATLRNESFCSSTGILCSTTSTEPCQGDSGDPVIVQVAGSAVSSDPSPSNGTWRLVGLPIADTSAGSCTGAAYADLTVPAIRAFVSQPRTLHLTRSGAGSGTLTGPGIRCPSTCSHTYADGTTVTLTASPAAGSAFAGWSGGGCSGVARCVVTLYSDQTISARFVVKHVLSVVKTGSGKGTVTSSPAGIHCGAACSAKFIAGATVRLTATPSSGSKFTGWSGGGCSGTGVCRVRMTQDQAVAATFKKK